MFNLYRVNCQAGPSKKKHNQPRSIQKRINRAGRIASFGDIVLGCTLKRGNGRKGSRREIYLPPNHTRSMGASLRQISWGHNFISSTASVSLRFITLINSGESCSSFRGCSNTDSPPGQCFGASLDCVFLLPTSAASSSTKQSQRWQ